MERHYSSLIKEVEKKKPNPVVVNLYLKKEFSDRRKWLKSVALEERVQQLLRKYPCFKDHVEVIISCIHVHIPCILLCSCNSVILSNSLGHIVYAHIFFKYFELTVYESDKIHPSCKYVTVTQELCFCD